MRINASLAAITLMIVALNPKLFAEEGKISDQEFRELRLLYETHLMSFPRYDVNIETKTVGVPRKGISDHEFVSYEETKTIRQQLDVDAKRYSFAFFSTSHRVVPDAQTTDPAKALNKEISHKKHYVTLYHDGVERSRIDFGFPWLSEKIDADKSIRYGNVIFIPAVWATLSNQIQLNTFSLEAAASKEKWVDEIQKVTKRAGDLVWLTNKTVGAEGEDFLSEVVINKKTGAIERNTLVVSFKGKFYENRNVEFFYETIDGVARPMRARSEELGHLPYGEERGPGSSAELLINRTFTWHAFGDQEIQWMDIKKDYTAKEIEAFVKAK